MTKNFDQLNNSLQRLIALNSQNNQQNTQQQLQNNNLSNSLRQQSDQVKNLALSLTKQQQASQQASFNPKINLGKLDQAFSKSIGIMTKELEKFARSGKFNLQSLAKSLLKMIMDTQRSAQFSSNAASFGSGVTQLFGGFFHDGGVVSSDRAQIAMPASLFDNAPRLHSGGRLKSGLGPAEFPAILQRGETVLTEKQAIATQNNGKAKVDIHIHENTGAKVRTERREQAGGSERIDVYIEAIEDQLSQRMMRGEGIAGSIEGRYNLNPNPTS